VMQAKGGLRNGWHVEDEGYKPDNSELNLISSRAHMGKRAVEYMVNPIMWAIPSLDDIFEKNDVIAITR
jgi:hypothetical protein